MDLLPEEEEDPNPDLQINQLEVEPEILGDPVVTVVQTILSEVSSFL